MSKPKVISSQEREEKQKQNRELNERTGAAASLFVVLNLIYQILSFFTDNTWVPMIFAILELIVFIWAFKGKWYRSEIKNHHLLQSIIDFCTICSIPTSIFSMLIAAIFDKANLKDKLYFILLDSLFLIAIIIFTTRATKNKKWKYNED